MDEQPEFQRELQRAVIIQPVFLADERGEPPDLLTLGLAGEAVQVVQFGDPGVERAARFKNVRP